MKKQCAKKKTIAWLCGSLFSCLCLILPLPSNAQQQNIQSVLDYAGGISIILDNPKDWNSIKDIDGVILDHGSTRENIKLYVTKPAYNEIKSQDLSFRVDIPEKSKIVMKDFAEILSLKTSGDCMPVMDFYPTYEAYESMMYAFETDYPDLCKVVNLGTLSSGRKILALQMGDNLESEEHEPVVLYTSSMHGDETAGYPLMLQLIDLLLCSYDSDIRLRNILDNITLYINPLANPDGAYRGGNNSIEGAIRFNSRFVDLNRNFPDPDDGPNPDNRPYQEETLIFMAFADSVEIDLACNMHGGAEVANYPWDTYEHLPADVTWWEHICRDYASSVQENSEEGYFDGFDNGITNGFEWYEVQGGRQDYMNYVHRTREFTLEYTNQKLLNSSRIPEVWEAHKEALLGFIEMALTGLHGTVTDCITGEPVKAEIYIPNHDVDNSSVFSKETTGSFYRYLEDGDYNFQLIADGYDTLLFTSPVQKYSQTIKDIELCPSGITAVDDPILDAIEVSINGRNLIIDNIANAQLSLAIYNTAGQLLLSQQVAHAVNTLPANLSSGIIFVRLESQNKMKTFTVVHAN
ncbi:MAG: T9SS type A sorting domain-containing protein [Saprospiraceae bacterium]|nr:T9SS type A sorting domain-containing protein [Saprospiraceae bacterium]